MAGKISLRGKSVDVPDCPKCKSSLTFDYIGKMIDYVNGCKAVLVCDCDKCDKHFICESGKVIEELIP